MELPTRSAESLSDIRWRRTGSVGQLIAELEIPRHVSPCNKCQRLIPKLHAKLPALEIPVGLDCHAPRGSIFRANQRSRTIPNDPQRSPTIPNDPKRSQTIAESALPSLQFHLHAEFDDPFRRNAEECRGAHRVAGHQREQLFPPWRHAGMVRRKQRLAAKEVSD